MPWLQAAAIVGGSLLSSDAAGDAADAQAQSAREANDLQWKMYEQNRQDQAPWREAGVNALGKLTGQLDTLNKPFGMDQFQADPGYGFRVSEGQKALERSAANRGNLLSGGALKGITRYGQDMASNEYANAYNRYNQDNTNIFNRLAAVSGIGQTASQQIGAQGMATGQSMAQNTLAGGQARASGYVGQTNALNQGIGGAINNYSQNQLMNKLFQGNSGGGSYGNDYGSGYTPYNGYTYGTSYGE